MKRRLLYLAVTGVLFFTPVLGGAGPLSAQESDLGTLIRQLSSRDALGRGRAASRIAAMRGAAEPAIPALITLLGDETRLQWRSVGAPVPALAKFADTSPADLAAGALAAIGDAAIAPLIVAAGSSHAKVRRNAADALGRFLGNCDLGSYQRVGASIDPRIADAMLRLLDDGDWRVRERAASCQALLRDPRAFDPLMRIATNGREPALARQSAMWALSRTDDERAVGALIAVLSDPDPEVLRGALARLRGRDDPRLVEPLVLILSRPNPDRSALHLYAIAAVPRIRDLRMVEVLIRVIERFVAETRRTGSILSSAEDVARAAQDALVRVAQGDFSGPACTGSGTLWGCSESRATHWRAWLQAQRSIEQE